MSFCAIGIGVKAVTIVKGEKLGTYTINSPLRIISHQHDLKLQYYALRGDILSPCGICSMHISTRYGYNMLALYFSYMYAQTLLSLFLVLL